MPGRGDRGRVKEKPKDAKGALSRIAKYLMAYKWVVLVLLACAVLSDVGNLLGPRFAGRAIGVVEAGNRIGPGNVYMDRVRRFALLMLLCYVGGNILNFAGSICMMRVGRKVARNMRRDVFDKLMKLPAGSGRS